MASYFYNLLLLYPSKTLSPAQPFPDPYFYSLLLIDFCCYIPRKPFLQHSLFQTPTSIATYLYGFLPLYSPKAFSLSQPFPDAYFYSVTLLSPPAEPSSQHSLFQTPTL